MSKEKDTTIFTHVSKSESGWDLAISDAEAMIQESQERITRLKRAIETFKHLRERGEPFPGDKRRKRSRHDF